MVGIVAGTLYADFYFIHNILYSQLTAVSEVNECDVQET